VVPQGLLQAIRSELERASGPLLAREIAAEVRRRGFPGLTRQEVNGVLYAGVIPGLARSAGGARWRMEPHRSSTPLPPTPVPEEFGGVDLTARAAFEALRPHVGKSFAQIFTPADLRSGSRGGKGGWGNVFERLAGGTANADHRDFVDGDLKTFACTPDGVPRNEVWLKNASSDMVEYIDGIGWDRSGVGHKIALAVLAAYQASPVDPGQHRFALLQLADLRSATRPGRALADDYHRLIVRLQASVARTGQFQTSYRGDYLVLKRKGSGAPRPTVLPSGRKLFFDQLGWYLRPQFLKDHGHYFEPCGPLA
jgi:hypothetical protein